MPADEGGNGVKIYAGAIERRGSRSGFFKKEKRMGRDKKWRSKDVNTGICMMPEYMEMYARAAVRI